MRPSLDIRRARRVVLCGLAASLPLTGRALRAQQHTSVTVQIHVEIAAVMTVTPELVTLELPAPTREATRRGDVRVQVPPIQHAANTTHDVTVRLAGAACADGAAAPPVEWSADAGLTWRPLDATPQLVVVAAPPTAPMALPALLVRRTIEPHDTHGTCTVALQFAIALAAGSR